MAFEKAVYSFAKFVVKVFCPDVFAILRVCFAKVIINLKWLVPVLYISNY